MAGIAGAVEKRRGALSRVTLVGDRRRIDLVLPADEPVGLLLPEVMRLLGDPVGQQPMSRRLVTAQGEVLAQDATLASSGIGDGAVVRLVREQETPAAPIVHDVTDEAADDADVRSGRWGDASRVWTAGVAAVGLALVTGELARRVLDAGVVSVGLAVAAVLATVLGAVAGRAGQRQLGPVLLLLGGAVALQSVWIAGDAQQWTGVGQLAVMAGVAAVCLAMLGLVSPMGRGALVGAVAVAVTGGAWLITAALTGGAHTAGQQARLGAVMLVLSAVVLGVLPRLALMGSGLTRLDDRRAGGASVSRRDVDSALAATHRGLVLATVVIAATAGVAGWMAAGDPNVWTVLLAVLTVAVLFSRARGFPLTAQVVALQAAGTALAVRLLALCLDSSEAGAAYGVAALCGLVVVALCALAVRPPEHVRVRLRRVMNVAESVSVLALLPLAVGAFGTYGRLLNTF